MAIRHIHLTRRQQRALLSAVVMLGVLGNALVLFICPHMLGGSCIGTHVKEESTQHSHCSAAKRSANLHHPSSSSTALAPTITSDECSECIMQGANGSAPTVVAGVQGTANEGSVQCNPSSASFDFHTITLSSLDLRDNGPPGPSVPIYTLINTYRI
jgi:hypothetical protein